MASSNLYTYILLDGWIGVSLDGDLRGSVTDRTFILFFFSEMIDFLLLDRNFFMMIINNCQNRRTGDSYLYSQRVIESSSSIFSLCSKNSQDETFGGSPKLFESQLNIQYTVLIQAKETMQPLIK